MLEEVSKGEEGVQVAEGAGRGEDLVIQLCKNQFWVAGSVDEAIEAAAWVWGVPKGEVIDECHRPRVLTPAEVDSTMLNRFGKVLSLQEHVMLERMSRAEGAFLLALTE